MDKKNKTKRANRRSALVWVGLLATCFGGALPACGTDTTVFLSDPISTVDPDDPSGPGGQGGAGPSAIAAQVGSGGEGTTGSGGETCEPTVAHGERKPTKLLIAAPTNTGLVGDKFTAIQDGLIDFFDQPGMIDDLGVALKLAPNEGGSVDGCDSQSCDLAACSVPEVPLGFLSPDPPQVDTHQAALNQVLSLAYAEGSFEMPMVVKGAMEWAETERSLDASSDIAIVVMGSSNAFCMTATPELLDDVQEAYEEDDVKTYTTQFNGSDAYLEQLAQAGGTGTQRIVTETPSSVANTLSEISLDSWECRFKSPVAPFGYDAAITTAVGPATDLVQVADPSSCVGWGWYDESGTMTMCPETCEAFKGDPTSILELTVACE